MRCRCLWHNQDGDPEEFLCASGRHEVLKATQVTFSIYDTRNAEIAKLVSQKRSEDEAKRSKVNTK